jgi:hypothetical protein
MAILQATLYRGTAPTSNGTLYAVPNGQEAVVTNIVVTNTTTATLSATISLDGVTIIDESPVSGNDVIVFDIKQVIASEEIIEGFASSSGLNFHISGVEIS